MDHSLVKAPAVKTEDPEAASGQSDPLGLGRHGSSLFCLLWLLIVFGLLGYLAWITHRAEQEMAREREEKLALLRLRSDIVGEWSGIDHPYFDIAFGPKGEFKIYIRKKMTDEGFYSIPALGDVLVNGANNVRDTYNLALTGPRNSQVRFKAAITDSKLTISHSGDAFAPFWWEPGSAPFPPWKSGESYQFQRTGDWKD